MNINQLIHKIQSQYNLSGTLQIDDSILQKYSLAQINKTFCSSIFSHLTPFKIHEFNQYNNHVFQKINDTFYSFNVKGSGYSTILSPAKMYQNDKLKIHLKEYDQYEMIESNIFYFELTFQRNFYYQLPEDWFSIGMINFQNDQEEMKKFKLNNLQFDDGNDGMSCESIDSHSSNSSISNLSHSSSSYNSSSDSDDEDESYSSEDDDDEMSEINEENDAEINVAIGLTDHIHINQKNFIGWERGSWAFHTDDGNCYFSTGNKGQQAYWNMIKYGDTIGCGYIPSEYRAFFTVNGKIVMNTDIQSTSAYFGFTVDKAEGFELNCGLKQFQFDPYVNVSSLN